VAEKAALDDNEALVFQDALLNLEDDSNVSIHILGRLKFHGVDFEIMEMPRRNFSREY
jgi:hypothetical protein